MEFDVFISYSSKDKPAADAACHALESAALRCWIAPRDIVPGEDWGGSIVKAIAVAKVMVLIFSGNANESKQILREVERAVNKGIPIIPVRIQDVMPKDSLEYFLSTPHWLDAFTPPVEAHLESLARAVKFLIGEESKKPEALSLAPEKVADLSPVPPAPVTHAEPPKSAQLTPGIDTNVLALCQDEAVLAALNEALKQGGYDWLTITTKNVAFGHSPAGDCCSVYWTGPTYDLSINYAVRRDLDRLAVNVVDVKRIL